MGGNCGQCSSDGLGKNRGMKVSWSDDDDHGEDEKVLGIIIQQEMWNIKRL